MQVFCPPRVLVSVSAVRDGLGGMSLRVGGVVGEVWSGSRTTSLRMQVGISTVRDGMGGLSLRVGGVVGEVWFGGRTASSPEPRQVFCPPRVQASVSAIRDGMGGMRLHVGGVIRGGVVWE